MVLAAAAPAAAHGSAVLTPAGPDLLARLNASTERHRLSAHIPLADLATAKNGRQRHEPPPRHVSKEGDGEEDDDEDEVTWLQPKQMEAPDVRGAGGSSDEDAEDSGQRRPQRRDAYWLTASGEDADDPGSDLEAEEGENAEDCMGWLTGILIRFLAGGGNAGAASRGGQHGRPWHGELEWWRVR